MNIIQKLLSKRQPDKPNYAEEMHSMIYPLSEKLYTHFKPEQKNIGLVFRSEAE